MCGNTPITSTIRTDAPTTSRPGSTSWQTGTSPPKISASDHCLSGKTEDAPGLCGGCRMAPMLGAERSHPRDQLGVALGQPSLVEADIVLKPGADMAAERQAPFV